jgi:trigger factor
VPTTKVERVSETRVKLSISVSPAELKPSIEHAYQHIAEQVQIKGFRKGKVPPQLIDQRVGKAEVINHAVGEGVDKFFREAVAAEKIRTLGRPEIIDQTLPSVEDFSGDLILVIETDVRPEFDLPKYDGMKITIDEADVTTDAVEDELLSIRTRFGTLVTVERPAKKGDFVTLDLTATIAGEVVDTAGSISYELGSGDLIDGLDEALDTLTADESTTFKSTLLGGDHAGEEAEVAVTVQTVKEREIPDADDEFAQVASQFDTIGELRADLRVQLEKRSVFGLGAKARQALLDALIAKVTIPVPAGVIEQEVERHLEQEGRQADDAHRAEVTASTETSFRTQILLDSIAEKEDVQVGQDELLNYMMQSAQQYGMDVNEFIQVVSSNGQVPAMAGEVARSKALSVALSKAKVVNQKGKEIDLSEFTSGATAAVVDGVGSGDLGHDDHEGHNH